MPATAEKEALPRSLGLFGAITIVVGITIGSGIFRSPAGIADRLPGPGPIVLRRRPGYAPAFRSPGYPIVPILFILATLYLLVNAVIDPSTRWATLAVFLVILVGIPVFYAKVGRRVIPPDITRRTAGETA